MGLVGATYPWHLGGTVGSTTLNRDIIVTEAPEWDAPVFARKMYDPETGTPTVIFRSDGGDTKRTVSLTFLVVVDSDESSVMTDLNAFWQLKGPWMLTDAEGTTHTVVADPSIGAKTYKNMGGYVLVGMGVQEV